MGANCWPVVLTAILGAYPLDVAAAAPPDSVGVPVGEACAEARYPFDAQDAWIHGYIQEIPPYGGFNSFRPYNYKHVWTQSQLAAQWGTSATAPYSQQFWQRYRGQASTDVAVSRIVRPVEERKLPAASSWDLSIRPERHRESRVAPAESGIVRRTTTPSGELRELRTDESNSANRVTPVASFAVSSGETARGGRRSASDTAVFDEIEQWPGAAAANTQDSPRFSAPGAASAPLVPPRVVSNGPAIVIQPAVRPKDASTSR